MGNWSKIVVLITVTFGFGESQYWSRYTNNYNNQYGISRSSRFQNSFYNNFFSRSTSKKYTAATTPRTTTPTTTTTTTTARPTVPSALSRYAKRCGLRKTGYKPNQKARRGRIIWEDANSAGANAAPDGSFPWMASLFLRRPSGEAYFMCSATILTPSILVSAAHCFNEKYEDTDWFARVGDNFIGKPDPSEQTFQVAEIIRHENFIPLSLPGGDGRNDIALLILKPIRKNTKSIRFDKYVVPACLPEQGSYIERMLYSHCEIAGWGMQEYNNSNTYPDSVRAAKITVGNIRQSHCNYLYGREVRPTGKFCAGGSVDACQEDSGGPLMCEIEGRYKIIGIVSSGKGCGTYPGLYTEVSKYTDWIMSWVNTIENTV